MSIREIFGTKAWWTYVALLFIANVFAVFMINGGREYAFLFIADAVLVAYIVAVWLGSQKIEW